MIRLATRASALALAQAGMIADRLRAAGADVQLLPIRTEGDRLVDAKLAAVGGKGLFVREIEEALLAGRADLAVHSLKDLPAEQPAGLVLAAFPVREDARDVLVTRTPGHFEDLPTGAALGTSSPRRRAIALALRPDLAIVPIRGNVDTRLRKLADGGLEAIVLAAAGLRRLGLAPPHVSPLAPDVFVPAVGQGILGLETRMDDARTVTTVRALDDPATRPCALAERAYLGRLGASCVTPMAAHARLAGGRITLDAVVASEDGRQLLRERAEAPVQEAAALGTAVAEAMLARGAASIVALKPAEVGGGR